MSATSPDRYVAPGRFTRWVFNPIIAGLAAIAPGFPVFRLTVD